MKAIKIACNQFMTLMRSQSNLLFIVLVFFIDRQITGGMNSMADIYGGKLNIFEPYIAALNNIWLQIIIPVIYIILMYDFPDRYAGSVFYLVRAGRTGWFYAQMIYGFLSAMVYAFIVFIITVLLCCGHISFQNGWSDVITDFCERYPEFNSMSASLLRPSTYYQGTVWQVFSYTFLFMVLNLLFINMVQLLSFCLGTRRLGTFICLAVETVGAILCVVTRKIKWLFPVANSVFSEHFENYVRKPLVSVTYSFMYFIVLIIVMWVIGLIKISKSRMTEMIS